MTRRAPRAASLIGVVLVVACQPAGETSPSPSSRASVVESSGPSASATPTATTAGDHPALVIHLGTDAAPIDVIVGFGSTWVANHHADTVTRIDPATGLGEASIFLGAYATVGGPGWFTLADDAVWVTRQVDRGMTRIDPATNEPDPLQVGTGGPCWSPTTGLGALWYYACDGQEVVRIGQDTLEVQAIPAADLSAPIIVDGVVYAVGPEGVVRLAEDGATWTSVGGCCGRPLGFAGGTLWLADADVLHRVDLSNGSIVATIPLGNLGAMTSGPEVAWFAPAEGFAGPLQQVRLSDSAILDELPVSATPLGLRLDGSTLWVTDYNASELWRVDLGV